MSFSNLKLIEPLLKALNDEGYTTPTPIQEQSIPIILSRNDLLGCAQTGTGKTAAFAIPMLQLLCEDAAGIKEDTGLRSTRPIKALILTPTRELAIQIDESFAAYGKYTGMKHLVIFGGVPQHSQVQALQRGIDILVATPGRLLDLVDQRHVNLRDIKFFVLDEADRMLDMGFVHDVKKIIARLPQKKQTLFFSATMPPEIQKLAGTILVNPSKVEVTPVSSTAETIQQAMYFVEKQDKRSLLLHVLKTHDIPTALVFARTKHGADKIAQGLVRAGIRAEAIHGNKSQNARQRALLNFKSRQTRILVATDIAARGIDIDELTHVINYELPNVPETYVHRIGRTGRAGASGIALSFCDAEEKEFLRDIEKLIGRPVPVVEDHPHVMHASLSYRPPVAAGSGRSSGNGRNGGSGFGRNNGSNGERRSSGGDRRERPPQRNGVSDNGNRRNPASGNQRNGQPQRPIQAPVRNGEVRERLGIEQLEQQDLEAKRKAPLQQEQQPIESRKKPEVKRAMRPNPEFKPLEPQRVPQQQTADNPSGSSLPFPVNQSSGDEKW
ncbi:MAG TPA: DEAD/DEAH box helicase [Puia sp.]|nr:DEAD/DEAH box helicase [Puia sp.]